MVTGFDLWSQDGRLRRHWQKRALAFLIDVIFFLPILIILWIGDIGDHLQIGIYTSLLFYSISALEEAAWKATAGKYIMGLRVRAIKPGVFTLKALIRNVNRLLWFVLPLLDFALGMATKGDPRQRVLDRMAGTTVVVLAETDWHEGHLKEYAESEKKPIVEAAATEKQDGVMAPSKEKEGVTASSEEQEKETAPSEQQEPTIETAVKAELCHECAGPLIQLADENYQCQKCGLIQ